jgi:hypothetical protein
MASESPKVFISYSHDSPEHGLHVLELANRLRADGINCMIDQYVMAPPEGWPRWMEKQIRESDFVLVVCTETYLKRVLGEEQPGKGFGVRWEGNSIYNAIYASGVMNAKFIPLLFEAADALHIPIPLKGTPFYEPLTEPGYEDLFRRLTNQPRVDKPELGKLLSSPPVTARKLEGAAALEVALSNLPERNPFFTGREPVLAQLQEALAAQGRAALSGLGGVGKTQTAVEYVHRHSDEYVYTFWATAHSREALPSGYATIARLLKLSEADGKDQILAMKSVKRWLISHEGWLLILDNADDIVTARAFIPLGKNGHVLLTTRAWAVGTMARRVQIQEMGTEEGALFLLRRAKYITEIASLEAATEADQAIAKEIATQLDGLPLALDQAGAYLEETGCGLSGYLDLYRSHAAELLRHRGALTSDHFDPVATTWELSFENIAKANPAAAELLRFCAFLHPDGIPEELFSKGASELGPLLGPVASDAFALNIALAEILKYSMLRRDASARVLEIHRLVQDVIKRGMDQATQRLWAERVVRAINRAFSSARFINMAYFLLLRQAQACVELSKEWGFEFPEAVQLRRIVYESTTKSRYPCIGAKITDLDWESVRLFGNKEISCSARRDKVIEELDLLSPLSRTPLPHIAAVLCFCNYPHRFMPQAISEFIVGQPKDEHFLLKAVKGPLSSQFGELVPLTMNHLETISQLGRGGLRSEETEIPLSVVREAISNAIAHRNYNMPGRVQVRRVGTYKTFPTESAVKPGRPIVPREPRDDSQSCPADPKLRQRGPFSIVS